jgi:hypothetical protein
MTADMVLGLRHQSNKEQQPPTTATTQLLVLTFVTVAVPHAALHQLPSRKLIAERCLQLLILIRVHLSLPD